MIKEVLGITPTSATVIISMYVLMGILEYMAPAERGHTWSGRCRNFTYTLIYLSLGSFLLRNIHSYLPQVQRHIHYHQYPFLFAFIYLLVTDFVYYWYHRAEHRWSVLWRIHELHHSDSEVNITTSLRTHWLEKPVQHCTILLPTLFVVGVDPPAILWWAIIGQAWEMFTHSNINCYVHPLGTVLCNPSIHRIHHSVLEEHHRCNFAQYFTFYDMIFGTYVAPRRETMPPTGTTAIPSDYSILTNIFRPFGRHRSVEQVKDGLESTRPRQRSKN